MFRLIVKPYFPQILLNFNTNGSFENILAIFDIFHLVALILGHSTIKSHCEILIQSTMLLPLLLRISQEYPEYFRLKSIIGKIIANISLFAETHKAQWTQMT